MQKLPWLLMFHLAGCSCGDAPLGAKYTFTAQGEGPEGSHLQTPRIGLASGGSVIDGTTELKAGRAFRTHTFHNETCETAIETPAGLFVTSSTVKGEFANPQLYVPAKVKVGMKWEVAGADGAADFLFEVTRREENTVTLYGAGTVWTIQQTFSQGTVDRHYLEGVGRIDLGAEIFPMDDQAVEVPAKKAVTMEELTLPESLKFTQNVPWIDGIAMVRPAPGGPALLTVFSSFDDGPYAVPVAPSGCVKLEGNELSPITPTAGLAFRRTTGMTCPMAGYCVPVPGIGTMGAICPDLVLHGNGARVADDGTVTWVARKWTGQFAAAGAGGFGPEDSVVKAGGALYAMIPMVGVDGGGDGLVLARDTGRVGLPNQFGDPFSFDPASYRELEHSFPNDERERKPNYDQMIDFGFDAQGRQLLLMRDLENVLFWSRLEGKRFTHPRTAGRISGRLAVQARQGGPDVLRITSDGSVDRLVFRDDEVKLEHLADVSMPAPHTGIGAFVDGDRLLIATMANGTPDVLGQTASLHLFRTAPLAGSQLVRIPQVLTISVRPLLGFTGETNAVCWRPTGEAVDLSTWKVGELTPDLRLEVSAGDQCVLIGFDTRQGQMNKLTRFSGVVPGVGRVLFVGKPQLTGGSGEASVLTGKEPVAVLADGSLSTVRRRYTRGAFDMGLPDRLASTFVSLTPYLVPDRGGAGLWVRDFAGDGGFVLQLKGQTTTDFPQAVNQVPHHALMPTGLATEAGWFIYPDGGIDRPVNAVQGEFCQRMSDGSWCGTTNSPVRSLFCQSPDGGVRTVPSPVAIQACSEWIPRGDGTWLLLGGQQLNAFDPVAMTLTVEGSADVLGWGIDFKGRGLFAKHKFGGPTHTIHLATPGYPEAFTVPEGYWSSGGNTPNSIKFVSTPDVTLMSVTWTGAQGTADSSTFRMPPVP